MLSSESQDVFTDPLAHAVRELWSIITLKGTIVPPADLIVLTKLFSFLSFKNNYLYKIDLLPAVAPTVNLAKDTAWKQRLQQKQILAIVNPNIDSFYLATVADLGHSTSSHHARQFYRIDKQSNVSCLEPNKPKLKNGLN